MSDLAFAEIEISTELKVPFFDVDSMDIVWHGHYVKYFEMARCELLDAIDYNYVSMRDSGYAWPVVDLRVKYIRSAEFNRRIRIYARLSEWDIRLKLDYRIIDIDTGVLLTKGHSVQVAIDMASKEMCFATPHVLKQKLAAYKMNQCEQMLCER